MGWSVDVIMPRRDGLRIWKILKKIQLVSDQGVEKSGPDHSAEKMKSDHNVEKLKSDDAVEDLRWTMLADNWVCHRGIENWVPVPTSEDKLRFKTARDVLNVGGVVSLVLFRKDFKNCVSLLVSKNQSQKLIKCSYLNNWEFAFVFAYVYVLLLLISRNYATYHIYPTPPLGQDMTQGHFLSGV